MSRSYTPEVNDSHAPSAKRQKQQKGGGKGGGGNRKGGKGSRKGYIRKGKGKGCESKTPGGKSICYNFNSHQGCSDLGCTFAHVCGRCFKESISMQNCKCA